MFEKKKDEDEIPKRFPKKKKKKVKIPDFQKSEKEDKHCKS